MIKLKEEEIKRVANACNLSYADAEKKIIRMMKSINFESSRLVVKTLVRMARDEKP